MTDVSEIARGLTKAQREAVIDGGVFDCVLKIVTVLDQFRAERTHRRIFLHAVAVRHDDDATQPFARRRKRDALPVISARSRDDAFHVGMLANEFLQIHNPAAHFERAGRIMIFVLHPDFRADALTEQRPADLRRRRNNAVNEFSRRLQRSECGQSEIRRSHWAVLDIFPRLALVHPIKAPIFFMYAAFILLASLLDNHAQLSG